MEINIRTTPFLIFLSAIFFVEIRLLSASGIGDSKQTINGPPKTEEEIAKEINAKGANRTLENGTIVIAENRTNDRQIVQRGLLNGVDLVLHSGQASKGSISFNLYTQQNPDKGQPITYTNMPPETFYNSSEKVVFLIHGYTQGESEGDPLRTKALQTSPNIKNAFMQTSRTENIVIMDWHTASREVNYFQSARNTRLVGETLAEMIISMKVRGFIVDYTQVYLVGFSLGAQISGVAGYTIRNKVNATIGRITGLDPAGPGFEENVDINSRLDPTDANFVDIIHCNAGVLMPYRQFGTLLDIGHIDFYPNGGTDQPGCVVKGVATGGCSHLKCPQLYASTVRGTLYPGCECTDAKAFAKGECEVCNGPPMGYMLPINSTGKFFLKAKPDAQDTFEGAISLASATAPK